MPLYGHTLGGQIVQEPGSGGGNGGSFKRDCQHLDGILYPGDPKREQSVDWVKPVELVAVDTSREMTQRPESEDHMRVT